MREIKFRAKRKLNGNWVFGSYIHIGNDWCVIVPTGTEYEEIDFNKIRVITDSVGEFTGLKDKHGAEIYEGDFDQDGGMVLWNNDEAGFVVAYKDIETQPICDPHEWMEIKGNIYENPEMIAK